MPYTGGHFANYRGRAGTAEQGGRGGPWSPTFSVDNKKLPDKI